MRPANPGNKLRSIYISDELWERIKKAAEADDRKAAPWIRRALENALAKRN